MIGWSGDQPYVLGIDGLPLGRMVAVAVAGRVEDTFAVANGGGRPLALAERVEAAVAEATTRLGASPAEVRLVCVDDGADGGEAAAVGEWLAGRRIAFRLLDLVGPDGVSGGGNSDDARSEARARDAAAF